MFRFQAFLALALVSLAIQMRADAAEAVRPIRVAFVISDNFNIMDFAGPWEVFQDVMVPDAAADMGHDDPYDLYAVAASLDPVTTVGGTKVLPAFTFANAPHPDIIVIGAQTGASPELFAWLREQHAANATIASVCTGASKLAGTGLLDGKKATTHHEYVATFRQRYPKVLWLDTRRFVHSGDGLYTAGGLTSGIDLALHLVAIRFGTPVAQATADYMEYRSTGWKAAD